MTSKKSFKLRSQADIEAEQKEKEEVALAIVEKNRKKREIYEIEEISGWMYFGPFLGLLAAIIAGIMIWISGASNTEELWWILGIGITPLMLFGFATEIDDAWKASVIAKEKIKEESNESNLDDDDSSFSNFDSEERTLNGFKYKYNHVYMDSTVSYWLYKLTKFVMGLSTIIFTLLAAVLLFMWLGSISIAPTTIIIILLIIIIFNQNKK